jgi:enamine deaminase RidA (YjgF/YER057c/UK114 family)
MPGETWWQFQRSADKIGGMPDASRLVRSPELASVAEYAYAAIVSSGSRLVFTAGACPLNEDGITVGVGDVRAQASQVLANLKVSLRDADASFADIVRTTIYVASHDQSDLGAVWEVVRDALAPHDPPSTLLGVAALGYPDQLVEIDAVAALTG